MESSIMVNGIFFAGLMVLGSFVLPVAKASSADTSSMRSMVSSLTGEEIYGCCVPGTFAR